MERLSSERRLYNPRRAQAARRAMFSEASHDLLESLQQILCDPTRAKIIRALMVAELTVGDLAIVISRHRSSTSDHLRILRELGIVTSRRRGRVVYNALAEGTIADATRQVMATLADIAAEVPPTAPS